MAAEAGAVVSPALVQIVVEDKGWPQKNRPMGRFGPIFLADEKGGLILRQSSEDRLFQSLRLLQTVFPAKGKTSPEVCGNEGVDEGMKPSRHEKRFFIAKPGEIFFRQGAGNTKNAMKIFNTDNREAPGERPQE